jgi:RNA polymerase sigma-70 factor (ECF subfamily)
VGGEDEALLLAGFRRTGDLALLGELYARYMPLVYGLCLKYLKDEDRSKDAVMEIFELLVVKLRIHEVNNFKSWLFSLSRNHCLMTLRNAERHPMLPLDEWMENSLFENPGGAGISEPELQWMEQCMKSLPPGQEQSIRLFYLQQKCYKEVAALTGFDLNKVKSYIQNGKRNLRICMDKYHGK